jgi:hypothetical protein
MGDVFHCGKAAARLRNEFGSLIRRNGEKRAEFRVGANNAFHFPSASEDKAAIGAALTKGYTKRAVLKTGLAVKDATPTEKGRSNRSNVRKKGKR